MGECEGCGGRCCMHYSIALSLEDVKRIRKSTGMRLESFVDFTPVDEVELRCQDVRIDGKYFYLTLKRDDMGCCVFSTVKGDDIKCGIHGSHPMACRLYPFNRQDGKVAHRRKFRCERKWNLDDKVANSLKQLFEQRERELQDYGRVAREWNRRGGSRAEFLEYLSFFIPDAQ